MDVERVIRPLAWVGSAHKDLSHCPPQVRREFGYALYLAQAGGKHPSAKPLRGFGDRGVLEMVEDHDGSTWRAVYTVRFPSAVYVLHVFQKKSTSGIAMARTDTELIRARLRRAFEEDRISRSPK